MKEITLVIVDDHPLFRQGVADALSINPNLKVIGQASHGERGLETILSLKPDIAIVDVNLPGMNGQQITHEVTAERIGTRVIMMTAYDDGEQVFHAAISGARAYCTKDIQPDELTEVIFHVANGKYVISGQVMEKKEFDAWLHRQLDSARRSYSEPGSPFHPLSDREMEVLRLAAKGISNKEIADSLIISVRTVQAHMRSIFSKLDVGSRSEAIIHGLKQGWFNLNGNP